MAGANETSGKRGVTFRYFCFVCDAEEVERSANFVALIKTYGVSLHTNAMFSVPTELGVDPHFPDNTLKALRNIDDDDDDDDDDDPTSRESVKMRNMLEAFVQDFHATFVRPLRDASVDILVFANSRSVNDNYILEAAKLAGIRAIVMDLPNLFPVLRASGGHESAMWVAPSHFAKNHASVAGKGFRVTVINPGFGAALTEKTAESILSQRIARLPQRRPVIAMVGRIASEKSPGIFVRAAAIVQAQMDADFIMIGDGPLRTEIAALAARIGARVNFTGWVDRSRLPLLLENVDVVMQPTLRHQAETYCISNVEAMAAGIPIVTFAVGGQLEYITNQTNAIVATTPAPEELAHAAISILRNSSLYITLVRGALRTIVGEANRFSNEAMLNAYHGLYASLLDHSKVHAL